MVKPVTFADIDRLLVRHGFVCHREAPASLAYTHPSDKNRLFLFPPRQPKEAADPNHVSDVRHHLVWWGFMEEADFDLWLCRIRFDEGCGESLAVTATSDRGRRAS